MRAPMPVADLRRLSWPTALGAHLGPGLVAFVAALLLAPAVARLGLPSTFALTLSCAFLLGPIEVAALVWAGSRVTGRVSWRSVASVLAYRQRLGRWIWWTPGLFVVALIVAIGWSPVGGRLAGSLRRVYPSWLLPTDDSGAGRPVAVMVAVLLVTLVLDGVIVPIVEELYFRAFLLPRLPVGGWRAVPISAALFAVQHYWQPFNWPLIFVLQVILTALVIYSRSIRLGIVMHVLTNCFGILLTLVMVLR